MKKATTLAALALCASLWLTLAVVPASAAPVHARWAEEIALNVSPDLNAYAGDYPSDPPYIHWLGVQNANQYENYTKCASFVTLVLQQAYGWDKNYFYQWLGHESPFATHYHQAIKDGTGFLVIQKITDIQSGDIIAIDYPDDAKDTGHVMIAAGAPTLTLRGATALMYTIEVIDSTKTPHDSTDTRCLVHGCPEATQDTGAGLGVFRLYANAAGTIVGYTWSPEEPAYYDQTSPEDERRDLKVGRLQLR